METDITKTTLFKTIRLILILAAALVIVAPVLAQGTVPGGGQTVTGTTGGGTLNNTGTANLNFAPGTCVVNCSATPVLDPVALNNPPPDGGTLLSGLNLQITNPPGVFGVPLLNINFQPPPGNITVGANGQVICFAIMNFDTSLVPPRWVALPTFRDPITGQLYTNARLLWNFALFSTP